jgi:hypothetical protein
MKFKNIDSFREYIYNYLGVEDDVSYGYSDPRTFIQTSLTGFFIAHTAYLIENDIEVDKEFLVFLTKTLPGFATSLTLEKGFYQFMKTPAFVLYYKNLGDEGELPLSIPIAAQTYRFPNQELRLELLNTLKKRLLLEDMSRNISLLPFYCEDNIALSPYCLSIHKYSPDVYVLHIRLSRKLMPNNFELIMQEDVPGALPIAV